MAGIYLDVPFVTQLAIGGDRSLNDWVGCWYASACMLGYYFEAGPRLGDLTLTLPTGLHRAIGDATILNKNENLVDVEQPRNHVRTVDHIAFLLRKWGPLLFSLTKTASPHWKLNNSGGVELAG